MSEPSFLIVCFDNCPFCGVGGERDVLPIPNGAVNHQCSQCKNIYSVRAAGFTDSWKLPKLDESLDVEK